MWLNETDIVNNNVNSKFKFKTICSYLFLENNSLKFVIHTRTNVNCLKWSTIVYIKKV